MACPGESSVQLGAYANLYAPMVIADGTSQRTRTTFLIWYLLTGGRRAPAPTSLGNPASEGPFPLGRDPNREGALRGWVSETMLPLLSLATSHTGVDRKLAPRQPSSGDHTPGCVPLASNLQYGSVFWPTGC